MRHEMYLRALEEHIRGRVEQELPGQPESHIIDAELRAWTRVLEGWKALAFPKKRGGG